MHRVARVCATLTLQLMVVSPVSSRSPGTKSPERTLGSLESPRSAARRAQDGVNHHADDRCPSLPVCAVGTRSAAAPRPEQDSTRGRQNVATQELHPILHGP